MQPSIEGAVRKTGAARGGRQGRQPGCFHKGSPLKAGIERRPEYREEGAWGCLRKEPRVREQQGQRP